MKTSTAKFLNGKCVSFSGEFVSAEQAERKLQLMKESAPVMLVFNDGERIEWLAYGGEKNGAEN